VRAQRRAPDAGEPRAIAVVAAHVDEERAREIPPEPEPGAAAADEQVRVVPVDIDEGAARDVRGRRLRVVGAPVAVIAAALEDDAGAEPVAGAEAPCRRLVVVVAGEVDERAESTGRRRPVAAGALAPADALGARAAVVDSLNNTQKTMAWQIAEKASTSLCLARI